MYNFNFSVQNIEDGQGLGIALTGMIIVFSVLTLISAFIVLLPKILAVVAKKFPESAGHHGVRTACQTKINAALARNRFCHAHEAHG